MIDLDTLWNTTFQKVFVSKTDVKLSKELDLAKEINEACFILIIVNFHNVVDVS